MNNWSICFKCYNPADENDNFNQYTIVEAETIEDAEKKMRADLISYPGEYLEIISYDKLSY